jgi:hypothetical protein
MKIDCTTVPPITSHTIMALVSDRKFLEITDQADAGTQDPGTLFVGVPQGAKTAEAHWFLNLPCQQQQ